jgi:Carboxypeptidase regulatory-like domain
MQLSTCRVIIVGLTAPPSLVSIRIWKRALRRRTSYPKRQGPLVCASLLLCMFPARALAQQTAALGINRGLPDAPLPQSSPQSPAEQTSSAEGSASVSGTVLDTTGAVVPGAQVSLTQRDGKTLHVLVSGANGEFTFTKLPASSYLVIVNAKGFAPFTSAEFAVTAQQSYEVPSISLSVGMASTEVTVRPTEAVAAEQIKA